MNSSNASPRPSSQSDDSPSWSPPDSTQASADRAVAALCIVGTPVSQELAASVLALEEHLEQARSAAEQAERRLRLQRDQVDDDLAATLAACQRLEQEKLAALGVESGSDTAVFQADPLPPGSALTLDGLRERHRAEIDTQKRELSKQYFQELQTITAANAQAMENQAQAWRVKNAEHAADVETLQRTNAASTAALQALQQEVATRSADDAALRQQIAALMADLHATRTELSLAHTRIHQLLSSTSWRASRPLRGVGRVLQWIKGR